MKMKISNIDEIKIDEIEKTINICQTYVKKNLRELFKIRDNFVDVFIDEFETNHMFNLC